MSSDPLTPEEGAKTILKLTDGKASVPDSIPAECWKALSKDSRALRTLTGFMNTCWLSCQFPKEWSFAHVVAVFKKDHADLCENY